ncbi:MAG: hypothetical protein ABSH33_07660 [Steroidobacteraceae bacterium]
MPGGAVGAVLKSMAAAAYMHGNAVGVSEETPTAESGQAFNGR